MPDFSSFTQWQPQAYGIWGLFVLVSGYMFKGWLETRKLSIEDKMARREGYARQVETLHSENRNLSGDLSSLRREYDEYRRGHQAEFDDYRRACQAENEQLRQGQVSLQNEVTGLKRRLDSQAVSLARQLGDIKGESGK